MLLTSPVIPFPLFVNVLALDTVPMIVPSFTTVPFVFVMLPLTIEFAKIFNFAFSLFKVTVSPLAPVNFTSVSVKFVAFVKANPDLLFKSTVEVLVPSVAPVIEKLPAAVVPNSELNA